jgi:Tol biopolymer transport system component
MRLRDRLLVQCFGATAIVAACAAAPSGTLPPPSGSSAASSTSSSTNSATGASTGAAIALPGWFAISIEGGTLWAVRGDGSDRHQLTKPDKAVDYSPTWAPDASRLAFRRTAGPSGGIQTDEIRIIQADGTGERPLVAGSFPAWSRDGAWIAFRGVDGVDLALIRPDGSGLMPMRLENAECPVWSPDGRRLLYCRNADASGAVSDDWNVWVMNTDGTDRRQLTTDPARDYPIAWSSDGARILFSSDRSGRMASYVMDADGTHVARVTEAADLSTANVWLPDGRFVIASTDDPPRWFVLDPSGARQEIPQLSGAFDPIGWVNAP